MELVEPEVTIKNQSVSLKQRWGETKTRGFILSYLSKPELWNTSCATYSQKLEKLAAYNSLMDEYQLTMIEVKNKIRIFRTTFSQERKKEEGNPNYIPK
jgi:hypothetical protein